MLDPIIGLVRNTKANRWHPIYFQRYPMPGGTEQTNLTRYRSGGHHTAGFTSREEAVRVARTGIAPRLRNICAGPVRFSLDTDFLWNGEDIPTVVAFFRVEGETAKPLC